MWTYGLASLKDNPEEPKREVSPTKYYTSAIHRASFILPPFLADMVKE